MELAEKETIININEADLAEGFWRYYTTQNHIAKAILKKFGPSVLETRTTKSKTGQITSWDFKLDAKSVPDIPYIFPRRQIELSDMEKQRRTERLSRHRETVRLSQKGNIEEGQG